MGSRDLESFQFPPHFASPPPYHDRTCRHTAANFVVYQIHDCLVPRLFRALHVSCPHTDLIMRYVAASLLCSLGGMFRALLSFSLCPSCTLWILCRLCFTKSISFRTRNHCRKCGEDPLLCWRGGGQGEAEAGGGRLQGQDPGAAHGRGDSQARRDGSVLL